METAISYDNRVALISNTDFETEVLRAQTPVLLLCMPPDQRLHQQIDALQKMFDDIFNNGIRFFLLEEDFIHAFKQMYRITGSPIFILFNKGKEIGRMLGMADPGHLRAFLTQYLPASGDSPGEEFIWG